MATFDEPQRDSSGLRGPSWRRLDPPVKVRAYYANQWHDAVAVDINDETRELRVELPTTRRDHGVDVVTHAVLNASLYQAPPGIF